MSIGPKRVSRRELKDVIAHQATEIYHLREVRDLHELTAAQRNAAQIQASNLKDRCDELEAELKRVHPGSPLVAFPGEDVGAALADCQAARDQLASKCTLLEHKYAALVGKLRDGEPDRTDMSDRDRFWLRSCWVDVEELYSRAGVMVVGDSVVIPDDAG